MKARLNIQACVRRRINQSSEDSSFLDATRTLSNLLNRAKCKYIIIGSCALQAHLRASHRLPHDIDVLISPDSEKAWLSLCESSGIDVCLKPGRQLLRIGEMPVHVLVGGMWLVDFQSGSLFDFIPIDPLADTVGNKRFSLLTAIKAVMLPVPSLELLFALTLLRPMNANSFLDCLAILKAGKLNVASLVEFGHRSTGLRQILCARLPELLHHLQTQRILKTEHSAMLESARRGLE